MPPIRCGRKEKFGNLYVIRSRRDGTRGAEYTDITVFGDIAESFDCGDNHAEHTFGGVDGGEVFLLDGAQGLGRGGVTCQYHELASAGKSSLTAWSVNSYTTSNDRVP